MKSIGLTYFLFQTSMWSIYSCWCSSFMVWHWCRRNHCGCNFASVFSNWSI